MILARYKKGAGSLSRCPLRFANYTPSSRRNILRLTYLLDTTTNIISPSPQVTMSRIKDQNPGSQFLLRTSSEEVAGLWNHLLRGAELRRANVTFSRFNKSFSIHLYA
jgi:hypothetical protein